MVLERLFKPWKDTREAAYPVGDLKMQIRCRLAVTKVFSLTPDQPQGLLHHGRRYQLLNILDILIPDLSISFPFATYEESTALIGVSPNDPLWSTPECGESRLDVRAYQVER